MEQGLGQRREGWRGEVRRVRWIPVPSAIREVITHTHTHRLKTKRSYGSGACGGACVGRHGVIL
jgi:hypothetical protein